MKYKIDYMEGLWFTLIVLMMVLVLAKAASSQTCMSCPNCPPGMACAQGCFEVPCGGGSVSARMRQRADNISTDGIPDYSLQYRETAADYSNRRNSIRRMLCQALRVAGKTPPAADE